MDNKIEIEENTKEGFLQKMSNFFNKTILAQSIAKAQEEYPHAILIRNSDPKKNLGEDQFKNFINVLFNKGLSRNQFKYLFVNGHVRIILHGNGFIVPVNNLVEINSLIATFIKAAISFRESCNISLKIEKCRDGPYQNGRNITIRFKKLPPSINSKSINVFTEFGKVQLIVEKPRELEVTFSEINWYLPLQSLIFPEKKNSKWFSISRSSATVCRFVSSSPCAKCSILGHHHSKCPIGLKERAVMYYTTFRIPVPPVFYQPSQKQFISDFEKFEDSVDSEDMADSPKQTNKENNSRKNKEASNQTKPKRKKKVKDPQKKVTVIRPSEKVALEKDNKVKEDTLLEEKKLQEKREENVNSKRLPTFIQLSPIPKESSLMENEHHYTSSPSFTSPRNSILSTESFLPNEKEQLEKQRFEQNKTIYLQEIKKYLVENSSVTVEDSLYLNPFFKAAYLFKVNNEDKQLQKLYEDDDILYTSYEQEQDEEFDFLSTHLISNYPIVDKISKNISFWARFVEAYGASFNVFVNINKEKQKN
jgi:hypothetical protein